MRNHYSMKVGLLSMALLLNCPAFSQEQDVDSLCMVVKSDTVADTTHSLKLKDVLIPTAVVGATSAFVGSPWLTRQREHVQDALSARGKHKFKVDEYSQYAPMVAVYGLDLCGVKAKHRFVDRTVPIPPDIPQQHSWVRSFFGRNIRMSPHG